MEPPIRSSRSRTSTPFSGHVHRLDVHEFLDAVRRELAPVAAFLNTTKGQPRVRLHGFVDENRARVDVLRGDAFGAHPVARDDRRTQTERAIVGDGYGFVFVAHR